MSKTEEATLIGYLGEASREPLNAGKRIEYLSESDAKLVRAKLYPLRRANPEFAHLSFKVTGCELWIINTGSKDPFE